MFYEADIKVHFDISILYVEYKTSFLDKERLLAASVCEGGI